MSVLTDHEITTRVDVIQGGSVKRSGLPGFGGVVDIDGSADTRRRFSGLTVVDETGGLAPLFASDLLAPFGTELAVYRGIGTATPLGVFPIDTSATSISSDGVTASLSGFDRSATVRAFNLEDTVVFAAGTNYGTAIGNVITTALPGVELAFVTVSHLTPLLVYETGDDSWEIATEMAQSIGMELFFDTAGRCVLRPVPSVEGDPVASYVHGEAGAFISLEVGFSGAAVRNRWVRISSNKTPPFRAIATDDSPSSITRYGGPAGKRTDVERSDLYETQAQAQAAADAAKAANIGATEQVSITCLVDAQRDAGDIVRIAHPPRDYEAMGIVDRLRIPLSADEAMAVDLKARRVA